MKGFVGENLLNDTDGLFSRRLVLFLNHRDSRSNQAFFIAIACTFGTFVLLRHSSFVFLALSLELAWNGRFWGANSNPR